MGFLSNLYNTAKYQVGASIDTLGRATGNRLPELGFSERLQAPLIKTAQAAAPSASQNTSWAGNTKNYDFSNGPSLSGGSVLGANTSAQPRNNQPQPQQPQQPQNNPFNDLGESARSQAQADLENALSEYDRADAELGLQQQSAEGQKASALSQIDTQKAEAVKRGQSLTDEAQQGMQSNIESASATTQDTVRKNRNILRALGILSSSAAGEMLARPGEEFAKTSADLKTQFTKRKQQVDDWVSQRTTEADNAKNDVLRQFNDIVARIQNDRRFNQRDKINAVQQAQSALKSRIAELNQYAIESQQAAQQYNQNLQMQIANMQLYQNPSANIQGILGSLIQPQQAYKPIQVGTLQTDKDKQLLSGY